jgi:hypothetical protein
MTMTASSATISLPQRLPTRLRDGDIDALADLMELLEASGTKPKIADFVLGIIWDLLPDAAHDIMIANAEAEGKGNVIDMFTRKPRGD